MICARTPFTAPRAPRLQPISPEDAFFWEERRRRAGGNQERRAQQPATPAKEPRA